MAACQDPFPRKLNEELGFSSIVFAQRQPATNAGSLVAPQSFRPGGRLVWLDPATPTGKIIVLADLPAGDLYGHDVSADGKSVVASLRIDAHDRAHLYGIDLAIIAEGGSCFVANGDLGAACRRLTFGPTNDTRPTYLPDGRIAFLREDPQGQVDFQGRGRSRVLFAVEADGSHALRLDIGPGHSLGLGVTGEGQLQFNRWTLRQGVAQFLPFRSDLNAVAGPVPDGAALAVLPMAPQWDGQDELLAACVAALGTWAAGTVCRRNQEGQWEGIVPGLPMGAGCSPQGRVRDPFPLRDQRLLVSYATVPQGCLNTEDGDHGMIPDFGIAILDPQDGGRRPVFNDPQRADLQPRPVMARAIDEGQAGIVPQLPDCGQPGVTFAGFIMDAQQQVNSAAKRLRVLQGLSGKIAPWQMEIGGRTVGAVCGNGSGATVPIAADASFHFRAPADAPLRLQVLDSYGAAIDVDPQWRGGPDCARRTCSGCHAAATEAVDFDASLAAQSPPVDISDQGTQFSFDFKRDIQPILNASCNTAGCHDSETLAGNYVNLSGNLQGIDLTDEPAGRTSIAYRSLLSVDTIRNDSTGRILVSHRPYVVPGSARESRVIGRLGVPCRYDCDGQAPWADWAMGPGKTHPEDQAAWSGTLTDEQRWLLVDWIDAGAPFLGRGASP